LAPGGPEVGHPVQIELVGIIGDVEQALVAARFDRRLAEIEIGLAVDGDDAPSRTARSPSSQARWAAE
jgi:hypothetical protein